MRRFLTAAALTLLLVVAPQPTHALANLPQIIPDCDQTLYKIQTKADVGIVGPVGPALGQATILVSPEEYGEGKKYTPLEYNLVGYTVNRNCTLNDFLQIFVNLFGWGLYVVSVLALLFLFIGGGTLLTSGGNEERVRSGKMILTNTVIGLAIALGSWLIVNTVVVALTPEGNTRNGIGYIIGNQPWFRTSASQGYQACSDPPQSPCKGGVGASIVRDVQARLYDAGCYSNPGTRTEEVDGSFGPKTLAAWKIWQQVNNITSPTETLSGYEGFTVTCTAFFSNLQIP